MLPLTPPSDPLDSFGLSAEVISREDGVALFAGNQYSGQQEYTVATPVSNNDMAFDSADEREPGERSGSQDLSDDDEDMSDGGADISTHSPSMMAQDAEDICGFVGMSQEETLYTQNNGLEQSHYSPFQVHEPPSDLQLSDQGQDLEESPQNSEDELSSIWSTLNAQMGNESTESPNTEDAISDLPGVMSELSQQLQHIHDDQEHGELVNASEQSLAADNSISPFPLLSHSILEVGSFLNGQFSNAYLEYQSMDSALLSLGTQLSHLGPGAPVVSPAHQSSFISLAQALALPSHFPSSEPIWDEDAAGSEADQLEVEDQFNFSLGEFLTSWSSNSGRDDDSRRRVRGPRMSAIVGQSDVKNLEPMEPRFLQGDRCDIQRINWEEIGVSRKAARELRRRTYRNYTNLRTTHHSHVSRIPLERVLALTSCP